MLNRYNLSRKGLKAILGRFADTGHFKRKSGTGKAIPVMSNEVKDIALRILKEEKGDLTYREWSHLLANEDVSVCPEKLRTWFLNDLQGYYAPKRVKPSLSDATKRRRFKIAKKWLKDGIPIVAGDEGWTLTIDPKRRHIKVLGKRGERKVEESTMHMQSKSNIPKIMVLTLITRPRAIPGVGFVGGQEGSTFWDQGGCSQGR